MKSWLSVAVTSVMFLACGGDDSTGPSGGISFPAIDAQLLAAFCVRGEGTKGETRSGSISTSDCDAAQFTPGEDGYFENWRIRVATAGEVTFDASSSFDNYLEVYRLESIQGDEVTVTLIGVNDDRAAGNLNALVTVGLQPDIDYFVTVSGYDYSQTGSYQVEIR